MNSLCKYRCTHIRMVTPTASSRIRVRERNASKTIRLFLVNNKLHLSSMWVCCTIMLTPHAMRSCQLTTLNNTFLWEMPLLVKVKTPFQPSMTRTIFSICSTIWRINLNRSRECRLDLRPLSHKRLNKHLPSNGNTRKHHIFITSAKVIQVRVVSKTRNLWSLWTPNFTKVVKSSLTSSKRAIYKLAKQILRILLKMENLRSNRWSKVIKGSNH